MRFGRLPTHPIRLLNAPAHRFSARFPPPSYLDRTLELFAPGLYGNDVLPDCTAVAYFNGARAVAALNGFDLFVAEDAAAHFYADVIGNPPDLAATGGAVPLDVLNHQIRHSANTGAEGLVARFGTVDHSSRIALASGIARLGFGYWGVTLRERDLEAFAQGKVWTVADGRNDGLEVGGHMVTAYDYRFGLEDGDPVRLATWGKWQDATWAWVAARLEEAWGLVWRQLARADGTFYSGLTVEGLYSEL